MQNNLSKKETRQELIDLDIKVKTLAEPFHFKMPIHWLRKIDICNRPIGRPAIVDEFVLRKLEHAFMYDCTVREACGFAGIGKSAYYEFIKTSPKFVETVTMLRCIPTLIARRTVVESLDKTHAYAIDYLSRKRKQEFGK